MQYLLMIYEAEADWAKRSDVDGRKMMADYTEFTTDIKKTGHFKAGDALQSVKTATTIRVRDGKVQRTDGPFAETKEQLGGYYLVEAKDLDEATKIAARIPSAKWGSIEIRPIQTFAP